jgi:hypothetical protein
MVFSVFENYKATGPFCDGTMGRSGTGARSASLPERFILSNEPRDNAPTVYTHLWKRSTPYRPSPPAPLPKWARGGCCVSQLCV